MESSLVNDLKRGLMEKHTYLDQWCEACETTDEMKNPLGGEDMEKIHEHLQVIDESMQKLEHGTLGTCEVCHETVEPALLRMDYTACVCLDHYSDQERRLLEDDLELSQVIQRSLLPQQMPAIQGLDIAAISRPAKIIGGDYFDFLQFKDGRHAFVVADISGHGVAAGMIMSSLQTAFKTLVPEANSPAEILERINRLYIHNIHFTTFATIFFGRLEPAGQELTYVNAGHNEGYLYRRGSNVETWLGPTGAAVGLMEDFKITPRQLKFEKDDLLLLYTDGVTEAENSGGEPFGRDRLAEAARMHADLPASEMVQKIFKEVHDFTGGDSAEDDITLMIYKVS